MGEDYKEWLKRAKSNLKMAKIAKDKDIFYEDLCFEAHQCAEKSLKALLIMHNSEIPKTHSFSVLIAKLEKYIKIPREILKVGELTDYAVQTRYPGDYVKIGKQEYKRAVELAEKVHNWAMKVAISK
ncbi:MAG: HEPN domain-containing protein [Spirochaetales bacterium]|nr:HEPN domain-containing protein [Spirochaetales bacterium]